MLQCLCGRMYCTSVCLSGCMCVRMHVCPCARTYVCMPCVCAIICGHVRAVVCTWLGWQRLLEWVLLRTSSGALPQHEDVVLCATCFRTLGSSRMPQAAMSTTLIIDTGTPGVVGAWVFSSRRGMRIHTHKVVRGREMHDTCEEEYVSLLLSIFFLHRLFLPVLLFMWC